VVAQLCLEDVKWAEINQQNYIKEKLWQMI